MSRKIKRSKEEIAVLHYHQYLLIVEEFAEQIAATVVIDAQHIGIEPHFAAAKRRYAFLLERDAVYLGFSHHVASRKFAFHEQVGKIHVELQHLHALLWFERDA